VSNDKAWVFTVWLQRCECQSITLARRQSWSLSVHQIRPAAIQQPCLPRTSRSALTMYIPEHRAHQTTMMLPNMISMRDYEGSLDLSRGCSFLFALSRYDRRSTLVKTKTNQPQKFGERFVYFGVSAPLQNYIQSVRTIEHKAVGMI
jgi:hypothetical protein